MDNMKKVKSIKKELSKEERDELLVVLKSQFEKNMKRHKGIAWSDVEKKLKTKASKLWSLNEMGKTGGEPDVVVLDKKSTDIVFYDCSAESPKGRRSLCYDKLARETRKANAPENSAVEMATQMGIELLDEAQYKKLQKFEPFDQKSSSWIETPEAIRKLGGAIFCDRRYDTVFLFHNGADSYYAERGFRGFLQL